MDQALANLWTPLAATPLIWLAVTLAAYGLGLMAQRRFRGAALASPVLIAIVLGRLAQ